MSRSILTSLLAICACAALVTAQAPAPAAPADQSPAAAAPRAPAAPQTPAAATPQAPAQSAAKAPSLIVEGCVQRSALAPSTTGAIGTAGSAAGSFILANAARPKDAPAAASSAAVAPTYRLDATDSQLSAHVGHKVAITGTVESAMASSAATPPAGSTPSAANAPRLKVESVKMIAAACAP